MNVTDPLENHRKNLYNFYLACNIRTSKAKSNSNYTDNYENTDDDEDSNSRFLPCFHFDESSVNENTSRVCDVENLRVGGANDLNENHITIPTTNETNCDQFPETDKDVEASKEPYSKNECKSDMIIDEELPDSQLPNELSQEEPASLSEKHEYNVASSDVLHKGISLKPRLNQVTDSLIALTKNFVEGNTTNVEANSNTILRDPLYVKNSTLSKLEKNKSILTPRSESKTLVEESTTFFCNQCKKTFRYKSSIRRHLVKCLERMRLKEEKQRLNRERPKKWTKAAIDDKTCKICGHIARKPCELKLHLSKHTGERPFSCKECGISFASTSKLNRHIRNKVHAKGKFYCEPCKIYFSVEANYTRHKDNFCGRMKPLACSICSKRFSRLDILRKHADVHSRDEREFFQCVTCERKFSRKDTLSRHIGRGKCKKKKNSYGGRMIVSSTKA